MVIKTSDVLDVREQHPVLRYIRRQMVSSRLLYTEGVTFGWIELYETIRRRAACKPR